MNPLKAVEIYSKYISNIYQKSDNVRASLPPHIYAIAEQCFRELMRTQQSQCILISGESGMYAAYTLSSGLYWPIIQIIIMMEWCENDNCVLRSQYYEIIIFVTKFNLTL